MSNQKENAAYLPDVWNNDDIMQGLMSLPKAKHINPTNYNRVVDFWKNQISEYCKYERTCLFSLDELKQKFRRGAQLPSPLKEVISELQSKDFSSGVVQSKEELSKSNQGWVQWGASFLQPSLWLGFGNTNGNATDDKDRRLVHIPTLKNQAKEVLIFYQTEYDNDDCPEVVDFEDLQLRSSHIVQKDCFNLVVDQLVKSGEVSIGRSKDGDKVLKFKDQSTQGPAHFTETDASVHDLRRTMVRLENEIKKAESKAKKFEEDARLTLRSGDRKGALNFLRKKKRVEKDIADKDVQYQRLLSMLEQLAQSKQTKEIIDIYKAGSKAFKDTLSRQGLTPEDVDITMDSIHEAMDDYNTVEEALRDGFRNLSSAHASDSVDETELESELNELLAEDGKKKENELQPNQVRIGKRVLDLGDLPDVPSTSIGITDDAEKDSNSIEALETRWKRLRTAAKE